MIGFIPVDNRRAVARALASVAGESVIVPPAPVWPEYLTFEPIVLEFPSLEPDKVELTVRTRAAFRAEIETRIAKGARAITIDCRRCWYIDSTGLGVLVSLAQTMRRAGGAFVLVGLNEDLDMLFDLTSLKTVLTVFSVAAWAAQGGAL